MSQPTHPRGRGPQIYQGIDLLLKLLLLRRPINQLTHCLGWISSVPANQVADLTAQQALQGGILPPQALQDQISNNQFYPCMLLRRLNLKNSLSMNETLHSVHFRSHLSSPPNRMPLVVLATPSVD